MCRVTLFFVLVVHLGALINGSNGTIYLRKLEKQLLDSILLPSYDPRIRPAGANGTVEKPLNVTVNMYVSNMYHVDDENMIYTIDVIFREWWNDDRLKYSYHPEIKYLTLADDEVIWTPDIFFNEFKGYNHDLTKPNLYLRIFPNGDVFWSKRFNLELFCPMELSLLPFDVQNCHLNMESYAWNNRDIHIQWKEDDPVQVTKSLHMPFFTLEKFWTTEGVKLTTNEYSYLNVFFRLKRQLQPYLITVFIPLNMAVVVAYSVFWINVNHFVARIIIAVATLFSTAHYCSLVNMELPKVPYTRAIDIYTGISLTFVFVAFAESIFVFVLRNNAGKRAETDDGNPKNSSGGKSDAENDSDSQGNTNSTILNNSSATGDRVKRILHWMENRCSSPLDRVALMLYPVMYILFLVIYWITFLVLRNCNLNREQEIGG